MHKEIKRAERGKMNYEEIIHAELMKLGRQAYDLLSKVIGSAKRLETLLKNGKVDLEGMDELLKYTLELDKVFVRLKQTQDLGRKITEK